MFSKTLLALSYLTLIPASQSFADYTVSDLSEPEETEIFTDEKKNSINPITAAAIVSAAVIIPIASIAFIALADKSTISKATHSEITKNELLGQLRKAIEQIDILTPSSKSHHRTKFHDAYKTDLSFEMAQPFNLFLMDDFLRSFKLIAENAPKSNKLSINIQNSQNLLLNGSIKFTEFLNLFLKDLLIKCRYHLGSDTPLTALENQRIFIEITTALLQSFGKTTQRFNNSYLIKSLTYVEASDVRDNFIKAQRALNEMTGKISQLFTNTSSPINYEYFRDWMNVRIAFSFGEPFSCSFPAYIEDINAIGGLIESIDLIKIDNPSKHEQIEIDLYNKALQNFIQILRQTQSPAIVEETEDASLTES
jgi:hypothetical protein